MDLPPSSSGLGHSVLSRRTGVRFPLVAHKMRLLLACSISFLLLFNLVTNNAFAHGQFSFPNVSEAQINEAQQRLVPLRFLPSHPLHFLILTKETLQRFLQPSAAARAGFDLVLSGKRIKEAYLLTQSGDFENTSQGLLRYSKRLDRLVFQFEKARSLGQEVVPLADRIAEGLKDHETMLAAINQKWQGQEDAYDFDINLALSVSAFAKTALAIDNVRPGLADRFTIVVDEADDVILPYVSPPVLEASPTGRPRRIIF